MKRKISLLLTTLIVIMTVGCRINTKTSSTPENSNYKIGIITGTVSQGEEEYQAAQNMIAEYGAR